MQARVADERKPQKVADDEQTCIIRELQTPWLSSRAGYRPTELKCGALSRFRTLLFISVSAAFSGPAVFQLAANWVAPLSLWENPSASPPHQGTLILTSILQNFDFPRLNEQRDYQVAITIEQYV